MPEADETIITRFIIEASDMLKGTTRIREEINKTKIVLRETAAANKESYKVAAAGMKEAFKAASTYTNKLGTVKTKSKEVAQFNTVMAHSLREVEQEERKVAAAAKKRADEQQKAGKKSTQAIKETSKATKDMTKSTMTLGDMSRFVFGSILGITAVSVLRDIIGLFKTAGKAVIDFSQAMFKLEASTRAMRRQGIDLHFADVTKKVRELRDEFGVWSRQDIVEGLAQIQLYTRQLGLSVDQMDQMIDAVATLSIVMGRDFEETARSVALFLASGYGEALQRAGIVEANRAALAHEALALGINKTFNELSSEEKALAGLSIIMRGVADLTGETALFQETLAAKSRTVGAAWDDLVLVLGERLGPFLEMFIVGIDRVIVGLDGFLGLATIFGSAVMSNIFATISAATVAFDVFWKTLSGEITFDEAIERIKSQFETVRQVAFDTFLKDFGIIDEPLLDIPLADMNDLDAQAQEIEDIVEELMDAIEKENERSAQRIAAIARDLQNDLDRIARDGLNDRIDIWSDYWNKLEDIARKAEQKIADAQRKAVLDRAQIIRAANLRRDDINRKYRERELKAEKDYQEKLRRLREDFLFDLEDALRERDALQVLRLTKKYNLEQARLQREQDSERGDLDRQRKQELADLERQTAERLRVLQEELTARIEAIQIAAQREKDAALLAANRKIEEERIAEERRAEERKLRAEEQKEEEAIRSAERLEAIVDELTDQYDITEEMAGKIREALAKEFGPGGNVEHIYNYLIGLIQESTKAAAQAMQEYMNAYLRIIAQIRAINSSTPSTPNNSPGPSSPDTKGQEGGTFIARRPTTLLIGEGGDEAAFVMPLNRIGKNEGRVFGGALPGLGGGRGSGKLALEILLSHGLEARIVETALDEVADVIVNVQRKR